MTMSALSTANFDSLLQDLKVCEARLQKRRRITEGLLQLSGEPPGPSPFPAMAAELSALDPPASSSASSAPPALPVAAQREAPRNDYAQHYVNSGERPGNFIQGADPAERFDEHPRLKHLLQLKRAALERRQQPAFTLRCDLRSFDLTSLGSRFDAILVDPPWEEYYRRCPALADASERAFWSPEEIMNLRIGEIAAPQSFIWLWVGSAEGLDMGRAMLRKWGYRRCEDICWVKTRAASDLSGPGCRLLHDQDRAAPLLHTKEHCLMGIRGTVRRAVDGHFVHTNIDTDVLVAPEPPTPSTRKPEELYDLIERFCLGARRLELFGNDHNVRPGWLTLGNSLATSTFQPASYACLFAESYLVPSTDEIESLRPKSPVRGPPAGGPAKSS